MTTCSSLPISAVSTLADIVTARPSLARVLEAQGLDYCCGGSSTLVDACAALELDADQVLGELAAGGNHDEAPEWATMNGAELVDHIEHTHHQYLWAEMPRLSALSDKVLSVHGERHPELAAITTCYETIRTDMEPHLISEEQVLFPTIRKLAAERAASTFDEGALNDLVSVMLTDHDIIGELLAELRDLTNGYQVPADGCASYEALFAGLAELEADTHLHVHKENNVLLPVVVALEQLLTDTPPAPPSV